MSQRKEKYVRFVEGFIERQKFQSIYYQWLFSEPPRWQFFRHRRWKTQEPKLEQYKKKLENARRGIQS